MDEIELAEVAPAHKLSVLDLPAAELLNIVRQLVIDDRRSLALSCKAFCSVVRSQWRVILMNPLSGEMPPPGIEHFSGWQTVVWATDRLAAAAALLREDWDGDDLFDGAEMARPTGEQDAAFHRLGQLLLAGRIREAASQGRRRSTQLIIGTRDMKTATKLFVLLSLHFRSSSQHLGRALLEALGFAVPDEALFESWFSGEREQEILQMAAVAAEAGDLRVAPTANGSTRLQSAMLFDDVHAGWTELDGQLAAQIVSASMPWCTHRVRESHRLESYHRLEALRISVNACDVSPAETAAAFAAELLPHLTPASMPALRELHLGRPPRADASVHLPLHQLNLPQLTKLVLNPRITFSAFSQLVHLISLHTLRIALSEYEEDVAQHPQDLAALSSLPALRSLSVATWAVVQQQDVAALQQLTELHVDHWAGHARLVKLARPMPNLRGVTLARSPTAQDQRYREDSVFARWALRKAAARLPNVQVLHLGALGSAPAEARTVAELQQAAEVVDDHVAPLLAACRSLDYMQLDTVMNVMSQELDRRCEEGVVQLTRRLSVRPAAAAAALLPVSGGEAMVTGDGEAGSDGASGAVERSGDGGVAEGGAGWEWERSVEWITDRLTEVLVAEFHYARVGPCGGGAGGAPWRG